jgi:outer membrane lipoprotein-sorting protein
MNDNEKYIEDFVKGVPFEDVDLRHRDALKAQLLNAFPNQRLQLRDPRVSIRRIMMRTPITKLAAAAAIVGVVWVGIHLIGRSSVAWAEVARNIQNARTLVYRTVLSFADGQHGVLRTMVRDPDLMRVELPDGRIWITDQSRGQTLLLDSSSRQAVLSTTPRQMLDVYDTFREFRNLPDFSVRRIGHRTEAGVVLEGFELTKAGQDYPITVWADPQTALPVRVEQTVKQSDGKLVQAVATDIVFDAELDDSLFSLEVPAAYTRQVTDGPDQRASKLALRMRSASKMAEIMRMCLSYVQEHGGQWPDGIEDLASYGLADDALVNPSRPDLPAGYIYQRPGTMPSPQQVVLYEAYDSWEEGVNIGCVDGHVEFIKEESLLKERLK